MTKYGLLLFCIALPGCTWFDGEEGAMLNPADDYLDARTHAPLVIPEDLRDLADTDPFPIPPIVDRAKPVFYPSRPPLPDAIYANNNKDEVRLQKLGDRSWLVVPEAPTTAWPKLKQFLADNGVAVAYDAPQVGRLNTQWLATDGQTTYRDVIRTILQEKKSERVMLTGQDRFLIRVEQGMRESSTEIHLRHENSDQGLPMRDSVAELGDVLSDLPDAETELLNEIGAYVAAKVAETTVSKVALQIGSAQKSELLRNVEGFPMLRLYLDDERAWATIGQALGNAEVDIVDRNRETGVFQVSIAPEVFGDESERGFLCRITFSCNKFKALDVVLQLEASESGYDVTVREPAGGFLDRELAQQVLVMIRDNAS